MIETLIVIGGVLSTGLVGLFVFTRNTKRWANRLFGLLSLALIILMVANLYTFGDFVYEPLLLLAIRLVAVATTMALGCLYFLTQALAVESATSHFKRKYSKWILGVTGCILLIDVTPLVFSEAVIGEQGGTVVSVSWGALLFAAHGLGILTLTMAHLINGLRKNSKRRRRQSICMLIGIAPTLLLAPITSFVFPVLFGHVEYVAFTPFYIAFFIVMVAYAMIRHGLFDIRLAVVRAIAYGLTLAALAAVYIVFIYLVSNTILRNQVVETTALLNPIAIAATLLIALIFQPIKKFFNEVTDNLFYKANYSTGRFVSRLNKALNSTNDLRTLLERAAETLLDTFKSSRVFFFVHLPEGHYMTAGVKGRVRVIPADFEALSMQIRDSQLLFLASQLDSADPVRRMMVSHRIELLLPLYRGDGVVGYLCLGEPHTLGYTSRDIRALQTVTDELSIAIQNALSVEQVKQLNAHLEQRIDAATKELRASNAQLQRLDESKDEFISMASHQLRTPLTGIKGYLSMLIEGDVGRVSAEQKKVLNEAFVSSERMVRLISDFLNVSRLQTGKFIIEKHPVDLSLLVQHEVEGLALNAAARGMEFVYKRPKNIPILELDENKIQQVIMNFADNAIYYSKGNAKIIVTLKKSANGVEFTVKDKGIGVPEAEQRQLFNKFFRATNARRARPDGTGVGIFLAKKVIASHGGTIIFESKEGKGSTFGFTLPLPKEEDASARGTAP